MSMVVFNSTPYNPGATTTNGKKNWNNLLFILLYRIDVCRLFVLVRFFSVSPMLIWCVDEIYLLLLERKKNRIGGGAHQFFFLSFFTLVCSQFLFAFCRIWPQNFYYIFFSLFGRSAGCHFLARWFYSSFFFLCVSICDV